MSTSYTYGGLDRQPVLWATSTNLSTASQNAMGNRDTPHSVASQQPSGSTGFVHGGLDREPVQWTGVDPLRKS